MVTVSARDPGWSVDELARLAELPVRTIREYQTLRLLEPPVRRGRVGYYGERHLRRLRLTGRLRARGYSLAGIRDLFEAWEAGEDLLGILDDPSAPLVDEAPAVLDRGALAAALPDVPAGRLDELVALGIVTELGPEEFCVPSPSLLALVADATGRGLAVSDVFEMAGAIVAGVRAIAETVTPMLRAALGDRRDDATLQLLRRGRGLITQGSSRLLLHELGRSIAESDDSLGALVNEVRVGAPPNRKNR